MKKMMRTWLMIMLAMILLFSCEHTAHTAPVIADNPVPLLDHVQDQRKNQADAYKTAITTLIQQDSLNAVVNKGDYTAIAAGMRQLDLSQCPRDFAVAYVAHMQAWEHEAEIQQAIAVLNDDDTNKKVAGAVVIEKALGADHTAYDDINAEKRALKDKANEADSIISTSYDKVEQVAVSYGVTLH